MSSRFSVGDVCSLQSGGQSMTAESIELDQVGCVWMGRDGRMRRDRIPAACLRHGGSEFDGIGALIIEGVTHSREEIAALKEASGNA